MTARTTPGRPEAGGVQRQGDDAHAPMPDAAAKARVIVEAALDRKAERPVALDVSELTAFADAFVIVSGRSDRQVRAITDAIVRALKQHADAPLGVEGLDEGHWVLIDCNDVVCHVFDPQTREHYDLERLWRDARPIDLGIAPERLAEALEDADEGAS